MAHKRGVEAKFPEIARYIAAMTRYLALYPGGVIWMGTGGTSPDLVHGDVVEVELTGSGVLRSPFIRVGVTLGGRSEESRYGTPRATRDQLPVFAACAICR